MNRNQKYSMVSALPCKIHGSLIYLPLYHQVASFQYMELTLCLVWVYTWFTSEVTSLLRLPAHFWYV